MQTKQPVHKLVILLLCGLLYLPACMDSSTRDKDDNTSKKNVGVKVRVSLPPGKIRMWETTFVRRFSDTAPHMLLLPPRAPMSDSVGGSAPDTIYIQTFGIDKVDSTDDDDDK